MAILRPQKEIPLINTPHKISLQLVFFSLHPATLFTAMLILITFVSNKHFLIVDIWQMVRYKVPLIGKVTDGLVEYVASVFSIQQV
jgi:hypothetical protein